MILIDTTTLLLHHVQELRQTSYAILSHTWGDDEVIYSDFRDIERAKSKPSYQKIVETCQLAASRDLRYVWIDNCCIDKSSSAELTEAINSMFRYYREAEVCFAYISDLPSNNEGSASDWLNDGHYRWFTRGWTLQELVAADKVEFYDSSWAYRGDKASLIPQLYHVTGIDERVLADSSVLPDIPVARKMSWACGRETTRTEDMAYCLLGLFDVSMPMIYGEGGDRAFVRLQEEIAKETNDLSLFAWTSKEDHDPDSIRGMFASSPAEFAEGRTVVRRADFDLLASRPDFVITNRDVTLETSLGLTHDKQLVFDLDCCGDAALGERLGIYLHQTGSRFVRQRPNELYRTKDASLWNGSGSTVSIQKRLSPQEKQRIRQELAAKIRLELGGRIYVRFWSHEIGDHAVFDKAAIPGDQWNFHEEYFLTMGRVTSTGVIPNFSRFIGIRAFDIRYGSGRTGRHMCNCLLICGMFEDAQGNDRPCAVVYNETEPGSKDILDAIKVKTRESNEVLLRHARELVISKHSPDGKSLCWNDVSDREVQVTQDPHALSIRLEMRLTGGASLSEDGCLGHTRGFDGDRTDIEKQGQDIASLPAEFSGDRHYAVSVYLSRSRRALRDVIPQAQRLKVHGVR